MSNYSLFKLRENTNLKVEEILSFFEYRKLQWQVRNSAVYRQK